MPMISVFISYSRDSDDHVAWVTRVANYLEEQSAFSVVFDEYDLHGGRDLTQFMELGLRCDRIVVVVTPNYVSKSEQRRGGVGYESSILSARVLNETGFDHCVPAIRDGNSVPSFLANRLYIDFRADDRFDAATIELRAALLKQARVQRPAKLGPDHPDETPSIAGSQPTNAARPPQLRGTYENLVELIDTPLGILERFVTTISRLDKNSREVTKAEAVARRELRQHKSLVENSIHLHACPKQL